MLRHADFTRYGLEPTSPLEGSMRDYTLIPRLNQINVPTLVWNGEFDICSDAGQRPFFELIPRVRWMTFTGASHSPLWDTEESRERVLRAAGSFLAQSSAAR